MQVAVRADIFYRALKSTAFAASQDFDPRRPAFSGILLDVSPTKFRAVATDGYRLALFESDDGHDCPEPLTVLLYAAELRGLKLPRASGVFKIAVYGTEATIQHEKAAFSVPVIQAYFPNYLDVFPPAEAITLSCEKAGFVEALTRARRKTTRNNRSVFFWIRPGCVAFAAQDETILSPVRIAAQCDYSASGVFNANYLRDAVQALPAGDIQIRFVLPDAECPIFNAIELSAAQSHGSHGAIRQLVMPRRLPFVPELPGFDS